MPLKCIWSNAAAPISLSLTLAPWSRELNSCNTHTGAAAASQSVEIYTHANAQTEHSERDERVFHLCARCDKTREDNISVPSRISHRAQSVRCSSTNINGPWLFLRFRSLSLAEANSFYYTTSGLSAVGFSWSCRGTRTERLRDGCLI